MKKLAAILCFAALTSGAFAQGLINFLNNPTTLISVEGSVIPSGQGGAYWFALVAAPSGTSDYFATTWAHTGLYGTNQNAAGRFTGGLGLVANSWAAGETKAFFVVGWSANNGSTLDMAWLQPGGVDTGHGLFRGPSQGFFGVSAIAPAGVAGGGPQSLPNLVVFGGLQGIQSGFNLVPVPEPATLALAGLGAAALLIFRRRN